MPAPLGYELQGLTVHKILLNPASDFAYPLHNRPLAKVLSRSLYSNIFEDYQLLINN